MPIKIQDNLPAQAILEKEHIFVMTEKRALMQDIRPLKIIILNLMPTKIETETQILRCLANTPLQIEVDLLQTSSYCSKNTSQEHMLNFYKTFDEVSMHKYDGLIITGAPVEHLAFEQVDYWQELCQIMQWSKTNVHSTFHICWGAQAGLFYHYGVQKHNLQQKISGVFAHTLSTPKSRLFRGFDQVFWAPHSRHTEIRAQDIVQHPDLKIMSQSDEAGLYIIGNQSGSQFFVMGHSEYNHDTLAKEYLRDIEKGLPATMPAHYFPDGDPAKTPVLNWRAHASLLYSNWLNYFVYQSTPYRLEK